MGINELTHLYPLPILPNPNPPKSPILTPLEVKDKSWMDRLARSKG